MKKSVKLRDFLNLAGIADEDNETQYKNFEKTVTKALKNVFGKDPAKDAAKNVAKDASAAVLNAEDPKTKLKNELDDLKKDYENNKEHTFGGVTIKDYEPKKFDGKTDEEIKKETTDKYEPALSREKEDLKAKNNVSIRKLAEEITKAENDKKDKLAKLNSDYADEYETVKNAMVKRGLGRSSIFNGAAEGLENALETGKASVREDAEDKKRTLRQNIADANDELYRKIKNLDAETAEKIKAEIEKATEKRDAEKAKVDEYNRVQKEKYDAQIKASEANGVKYDEKLTKEYAAYYGSKFKALYKYYTGLGEKAAEQAAKDKAFIIENLDEDGYNTLLRYLK
ncbi:MAG: hypothetical protein PUI31_02755 [Clostridia bacterium]|nr:hypothetical protein [Clostridiales bacterium]MDD7165576.1 hypothetical protein [Clostridia bacterium]